MLDIKFIRENLDKVRAAIKNKNSNANLDHALTLDDQRRKLIIESEAIRSRRNEITADLQKEKKEDLIEESKKLKEMLGMKETELKEIEAQWLSARNHLSQSCRQS